jgi:hypothetical protein
MMRRETALPSRLVYTALLLAGVLGATLAGSLLLTEPALTTTTRAAFSVLTFLGLAWAAFATWVLMRRQVLYAAHRVAGSVMAMTFTAVFTLGVVIIGAEDGGGSSGWLAAAATGATLFGAAVALFVRARARHRALSRRRRELEAQVGDGGAANGQGTR